MIKSADRLDGIQFGRAVAAVLVVLYHANRMLLPYIGQSTLGRQFAFGDAGVDFFFVLSGFIIYYVHADDLGRPERLGRYLWRRFSRIYPIYWVVTGILVAQLLLKGALAPQGASHVLLSLALIPESQQPVLGVAWTLCHEVLFYLAFAAAIVSFEAGIVLALAGIGLVLYGLGDITSEPYRNFFESPYHLDFLVGLMTAYSVRRHPSARAPAIAALGIISFAAVAIWGEDWAAPNGLSGRLLYGLSSALIVYGIAVWENSGSLRVPCWAAYLGAASYSIYLIHTVVLGLFGKLFAPLLQGNAFAEMFFLLAATFAVAAGCVLYEFVERPLQALIRARMSTARQPKFIG